MPEKFKDKYRIPSARWQNWDYGLNGAYFITICTDNKVHYLGQIINQKMQLSSVGVIADLMWHEIVKHANHVSLGEFIVMPNHIHGIIILNNPVETRHALPPTQKCKQSKIQKTGNQNTSQLLQNTMQGMRNQNTPQLFTNMTWETRHALSLRDRFQNQGKNTISSIVGSYKSAVTKHANRLNFKFKWQTRFHDHIIRNEKSFQNISNYIINNPIKWSEDRFYKRS